MYSIAIILISVVVTSSVSVVTLVNNSIDEKSQELHGVCLMLGNEISNSAAVGAETSLGDFASGCADYTGYRITLIRPDGVVLADSEAGDDYVNMQNHSNRPEVIDALATGSGHARRVSATFGREFIYEAVLQNMPDGSNLIVRVSLEVDKVKIASGHAQPTVALSAIIGIALGIVIAALYTRRLTRPIREMEKELAETFEKYKKADNIRKEFVANVTHELKTPLTSIAGFVETLQGGAGDKPEVRSRFLEIISLEAARLSRLIDDTLIISDIENGRDMAPLDGDVDVKQAIEEVLESLQALAESKSMEMRFEYQYEMHIGGNEGRFKQMMLNLVENAIKYSEDGKHVYIKAEKNDDGYVHVSVRDEGIGISEEDIPRVFERFYRVDKSRSREAGGTGLGLAIVKHIATLFNATLEVESEPGAGSVFTICFPPD